MNQFVSSPGPRWFGSALKRPWRLPNWKIMSPNEDIAGAQIVSRSLYRATLPLRFSSNLSNCFDIGCTLHGSERLQHCARALKCERYVRVFE
jgi:hypothetical protein